MFKCPHCKEYSFSFWDKFFLVIHKFKRTIKCKKCGGLVSNSTWFSVVLFVLVLVIYIPLNILIGKTNMSNNNNIAFPILLIPSLVAAFAFYTIIAPMIKTK